MNNWKLLPYLTSFLQEGGLEESHCQMVQDVFDSITAAASSSSSDSSSIKQDKDYMNANDINNNLRSLPDPSNSDQGQLIQAGNTETHHHQQQQQLPIQENGFKGILNIITEALQEPDLNRRFQQVLTGTARAFVNFERETLEPQERGQNSNMDGLRSLPLIPTESPLQCTCEKVDKNQKPECQSKLLAQVFDEPVWLESTEDINAEFQRVKKRAEMKRKEGQKMIHQDLKEENTVISEVESTMIQIGDTMREEIFVDALESSALDETPSNESLYFTDAYSDTETIIVQNPSEITSSQNANAHH